MERKAENTEIAKTIYSQLGGGRAMVMIGGDAIIAATTETASLVVKFRTWAKDSIKMFSVDYDFGRDTYTVKFQNRRGTEISSHSDVYADDLRRLITSETGLFLSL